MLPLRTARFDPPRRTRRQPQRGRVPTMTLTGVADEGPPNVGSVGSCGPVPAIRPREVHGEMSEPTRRHLRYEIETQVIYKTEALPTGPPSKAKPGRTRNLSDGGRVSGAEERLSPSTRLTLLIARGGVQTIEGQGEVV